MKQDPSVKDFNSALELMQYKNALDQVVNVAITDLQGRIVHINDRMCKLTKYSKKELLGHDFKILNSGHHPKGYFQKMWETIIRGEIWSGEICNRTKDGNIYWEDAVVAPLFDSEGLFHQFLTIRKEITEQKIARDTINNLIADACPERGVGFFDALTENLSRLIPDSDIFIIEHRDAKNEVLCHIGSKETVNDYSSVLGSEFVFKTHESNQVFVQSGPNRFSEGGKEYNCMIGVPLRDGASRPLGSILILVEKDISSERMSHLQAIIEVFRRQAVREMEHKKRWGEASDLNRKLVVRERKLALNILAAEMGHVLESLFSDVQENIKAIVKAPKKTKKSNKDVSANTETLMGKLEEFSSSLNELRSPRMTLDLKEHALGELLDQVLLLTREKYSETGVMLQIHNSTPDLKFQCDITGLTQALVNILFNAIRAASRSKRKEVIIDIKENEEMISIDVIHFGPALPAEIAESLTKSLLYHTVYDTTAIGLYITKRIFEMHKGELEFKTKGKENRACIKVAKKISDEVKKEKAA